MIFVTVGAQMPFDRLVRAVDEWARLRGRDDVVAQIGPDGWAPRHIRSVRFVNPDEYLDYCRSADHIVAHAGTGSILTALQIGKPILVMPRRAALRETRNDHQLATVARFRQMAGVEVAADERELPQKLDAMTSEGYQPAIGGYADERLLSTIRQFIHGRHLPA